MATRSDKERKDNRVLPETEMTDTIPKELYGVHIPELPPALNPIQEPNLDLFLTPDQYMLGAIKTEITQAIHASATDKDNIDKLKVVVATDNVGADLAIACHAYAKAIGQSPRDVAKELAGALSAMPLPRGVKAFEAHDRGFVNIVLEPQAFSENVLSQVEAMGAHYGEVNIGNGKRVLIDASSPNTAKEASVGHLRPTVSAEALADVYRAAGYTVIRDNHLGDWGSQFGKLARAYELWKDEIPELQKDPNSIKGLQKLYQRITSEVEKVKAAVQSGEPVDQSKLDSLEQAGRDWFRRLESNDPEALRLWQWVTEISMRYWEVMYKQLGVNFEYIIGESQYVSMTNEVVDRLVEAGVAEMAKPKSRMKAPGGTEEATEVDSSAYTDAELAEVGQSLVINFHGKLPDALLRKRDGTTLYLTRDIATLIAREAWFHPDKVIYPVGAEQTAYFKQLFETMRMFTHNEDMELVHIPLGTVKIDGSKMSTRKGNVVELQELVDEAIKLARQKLEKNVQEGRSTLSGEELESTAKAVGVGTSVYLDLKASRTRSINITNLQQEVDFDGNTAAYLQYTCARAMSIGRQAQELDIRANYDLPVIVETQIERDIYKQLAQLPEAVAQAVEMDEPARISEYVYQLASLFNTFYHEHRVLKEPDEQKRSSRLRLTEAVAQTIHNALALIMIETPAKM